MRAPFWEPVTAGLILTMAGWDVQVGQAFSHDAPLRGTTSAVGATCTRVSARTSCTSASASARSTQLSAVFENPEFVSFRNEKLGPGRSGGGMEDELVMKDRPPRTLHRDEPMIAIPTSPEVAEYIISRQQPLPSQYGRLGDDTTLSSNNNNNTNNNNNNNNPTHLIEKQELPAATTASPPPSLPDNLWARQTTQRQEMWDDSLRQVEATTQSAKDWMKAKLETVMDTQTASPPQQTQQKSEDAMKAHNDNINPFQRLLRWNQGEDLNTQREQRQSADQVLLEPSEAMSPAPAPAALIDDLSQNQEIVNTSSPTAESPSSSARTVAVSRTDANGVPDDIDYETREKYEKWKRTREQLNAVQEIRPTRTTTEARYTPPPSPSSTQAEAQTRRFDPAQWKKNDQTIIVQAVRNDGKANESTYSADFVSGRAIPTPSQTVPIIISRPFFIESPEDLFFVDIGEAAMIKLAIDAQQSYYYPKNQGVAGVSATDGTGNWESGPYEYRVSTPEIDQPKSWLGSLLSKSRVTRENRPSDRITPINPKAEYTEFAVRRMPSGTLSSRRRHERLLQRSAHRSPYGYSYPRTKTRGINRRQGSDLFPSPLGNSPWMEPPPESYYYNYELTRPQSRRRVRQRWLRPPPPPPNYPPRQYYD